MQKGKEESKVYAQKCETNMTQLQELQRCWSRVSKQMGRKDTWICCMERANLNTYAKLNKAKGGYKKRMLEFDKTAPKYDGNPEKVFEWCEHLETDL